jgi:hypothetical protein
MHHAACADVSAETACEILHKALSRNVMGVGASATPILVDALSAA